MLRGLQQMCMLLHLLNASSQRQCVALDEHSYRSWLVLSTRCHVILTSCRFVTTGHCVLLADALENSPAH